MEKKILDACCGSRMFWFDKKNPNVLFMDKRAETLQAKDRDKIRIIEVKPDIVLILLICLLRMNLFIW